MQSGSFGSQGKLGIGSGSGMVSGSIATGSTGEYGFLKQKH